MNADDVQTVKHFRDPEIKDLRRTSRRQKNIGWLDIPVYQTMRVCRVECVSDLCADLNQFRGGEWFAAEPLCYCDSFQVLHHEVRPALMFADVVQGADIWVIECRDCVRLASQPLDGVGLQRLLLPDKLEGDHSVEPYIRGAVYRAHAAAPNLIFDAVVAYGDALHGNQSAVWTPIKRTARQRP